MITLTSQERRPTNNGPAHSEQTRPVPTRVTLPDRETLRDFADHLKAKDVTRKTLKTCIHAAEALSAFRARPQGWSVARIPL